RTRELVKIARSRERAAIVKQLDPQRSQRTMNHHRSIASPRSIDLVSRVNWRRSPRLGYLPDRHRSPDHDQSHDVGRRGKIGRLIASPELVELRHGVKDDRPVTLVN